MIFHLIVIVTTDDHLTLSSPQSVCDLQNDLDLVYVTVCLCSIVDSLQECCHCNYMSVIITSVDLVNDLLTLSMSLVCL